MSATGTKLIEDAETYLNATGMPNTTESWSWVMDAAMNGTIDVSTPPTADAHRTEAIDLFDAWADQRCGAHV